MGRYYTTTSLATYLMGTNVSDTATANLMGLNIVDAQNEIDKYVGRRYDVSAWESDSTVPPMIKTWCQWLSAGYYWEASGRGSKESIKRSITIIKRAMDNLKMVSEGDLEILDSSGSALVETSSDYSIYSNTEDYASTFAEDTSTNWKVDPDKLSDIESERS